MTKIKTSKKQAKSPRDSRFEKLLSISNTLQRKAEQVKKQILREIEADWLFNNLTSYNQSYSL